MFEVIRLRGLGFLQFRGIRSRVYACTLLAPSPSTLRSNLLGPLQGLSWTRIPPLSEAPNPCY